MALFPAPTPLEPAPRFSEAIGREVWIKRDDVGSVGYAGNKIRKLSRLVAEIEAQAADTLVIVGARQSNAARATAALCAARGWSCVVVVPDDPPVSGAVPEANALLGELFGARYEYLGAGTVWAEAEAASQDISGNTYVLPAGASSPLGALGFVDAHRELLDQLNAVELIPAAIVHASTSGGTSAGLHLGRARHGGPPIVSIDVGRLYGEDTLPRLAALATNASALLEAPPHAFTADDLTVSFAHVGDGYGVYTEAGLAAIRLLARTEGIVCDPVYSGKALGALVTGDPLIPVGDDPLVFWHTGGAQSVFADKPAGALLAA
ncbi:pyridoxal-phosphate dependent enzyme [Baekduia sp. Peel2402]|uniref:pyridoxal-phosphate dependent enzyme n=1 Tax=Baekduia sp. Peel2402 TaxID=3458296 RepID=UPI00403E5D48